MTIWERRGEDRKLFLRIRLSDDRTKAIRFFRFGFLRVTTLPRVEDTDYRRTIFEAVTRAITDTFETVESILEATTFGKRVRQ